MTDHGFLSLIPALVTIALAFATRRVAWSLFFGVAAGVGIASAGDPGAFPANLARFLRETVGDAERLQISLFIMTVGGLLDLISVSGAYYALAEASSRFLSTARRTRLATWIVGVCMFFDDYANVLIAGSSMKRINAARGVSPALSAYIVDIVSEIASVALVSTWAAYEGAVMFDAFARFGGGKSSLELLIDSLPYHFYTYLGILFALLAAFSGRWLGARLDTRRIDAAGELAKVADPNARLSHVLVPLAALILCSIAGLFVAGYLQLRASNEAVRGFFQILAKAPTVTVLLASSAVASLVGVALMRRDGVLRDRGHARIYVRGALAMYPAALIILLSNGLAKVSELLGTGAFITQGMAGAVSATTLPALVFLAAMLITVAVGISWSSMAVMMPVAYQMAFALQSPDLVPVLSGAVISGAISGAHLVPFSDKSVMTAAACKITPSYHVKTQAWHVLSTILASVAAYLIYMNAGSAPLALLCGGLLILAIHALFARPDRLYLEPVGPAASAEPAAR